MEKEYTWKIRINRLNEPEKTISLYPDDEVYLVKETSEEVKLYPPVKPKRGKSEQVMGGKNERI